MPNLQPGLIAARPVFNRANTDESSIEMQRRQSMRSVHSLAQSSVPDDASEAHLMRTGAALKTWGTKVLDALTPPKVVAEPLGRAAVAVAPYVKDGLYVAAGIGMAVWLGILTGKIREIEDVPMCMQFPVEPQPE